MANPTQPGATPKFVGKYRIVRLIARSNDTVYEAVDPSLGRHVALKELTLASDLNGAARRERIERFQREAKAAGALQHPNIVTIFEVGQHLEHRFIAMEYLDGQTLRDRMSIGGPMPMSEVLSVTYQLCEALGYAHAQGVIHRDVKPDNVHIVAASGAVKLTDFGIARILSESGITAAGQVFGTPSYMSPEQLTSRAIDHRTDIFSTAVMVYEMMVGKKPFRGESLIAVTNQIMNTPVEIPATIPSQIGAVLEKALAKEPDRRYQNMRTFALELRRAAAAAEASRPITSSLPATSERTILSEGREISGSSLGAAPLGAFPARPPLEPSQRSMPLETSQRQPPPQTFVAETVQMSLLESMDADPALRGAMLRLIGTSTAMVALIAVTLWGMLQFSAHFQDNMHHAAALADYEVAISDATDGQLDPALARYRLAMSEVPAADPIYDRCRRGISDCLTAVGAQAQARGDQVGAEESYINASKMDPSNAVPHFDLATLYNGRGDSVSALREYAEAHTVDPQSISGMEGEGQALAGYLVLGNQNSSEGDTIDARQDWQRVIDLDPGSTEADEARTHMAQTGG